VCDDEGCYDTWELMGNDPIDFASCTVAGSFDASVDCGSQSVWSNSPNCGFGYGTVCVMWPVAPDPGTDPPPEAEVPSCTLEVESRPLDYDVLRHGPDLHGFLDFTGPGGSQIFEGLHQGNKLTATGHGVPAFGTDDGSVSGPGVCYAASILEGDVANINNANITYHGLGPNSSSALRYMLQSLGYLLFLYGPWYHIPLSMQISGYYVPLPGLETAPGLGPTNPPAPSHKPIYHR